MKMKTWIVLFVLAVLVTLLVTPVLAGETSEINWYVIGGGGGPAGSSVYTLNGTIGQPLVGLSNNNNSELCSGFWCLSLQWIKIYMPAILR
jgi:hypothetical protein